ncbi:hypothetical protein FRB94_011737 [Tulasnella sp. JGI-2019a]|nr:hypothetical protein FRB93_009787 [Tulasnella sp. JGI-2019a]KAG8992265.1 hypothetical protein FRB94_011737 [Tulasnella sp. JGI-2019a]
MVQINDMDTDPDLDLASTPDTQPSDVVMTNDRVHLTEARHAPPAYISVAQERGKIMGMRLEGAQLTIGGQQIRRPTEMKKTVRLHKSRRGMRWILDLLHSSIETTSNHNDAMNAPDSYIGLENIGPNIVPQPPGAEVKDTEPDVRTIAVSNEASGALGSRVTATKDHDFSLFNANDAMPSTSAPGGLIAGSSSARVVQISEDMDSDDDVTSLQSSRSESDFITSFDQTANRDVDFDHSYHHHDQDEPQQTEKYRMDLLPSIKGLFRLLDLYSEQGSGGLVDKIIIAQDSLKSLINALSPGAYTSITKIDFATLDQVSIKAVGLYGSKSELVRVLRETGAVDEETANLLLLSDDDRKVSEYSLRSGIYLLDPSFGTFDCAMDSPPTVHIIYWPEDTTWDDTATGGVKRNRVTFMRYLTRLTDQIRALVSPEHAAAFGDSDDRFFGFEVAKTREQEEDAQIHAGFILKHPAIDVQGHVDGSAESAATPSTSSVTLVAGESQQGFMVTSVIPGKDVRRDIHETYNPIRLASLLGKRRIYLDQSIDDEALRILLTMETSPVASPTCTRNIVKIRSG